jgi:hypothetical protein
MKNKPSYEEVAEFNKQVNKWVDSFGLRDWRVVFSAKPAKDALADVCCDVPGRLAVYRLGTKGSNDVSDHTPDQLACHEMVHVLLANYHALVEAKADAALVDSEEHRIVHTLVRLLCPAH